MSCFYDKFIEKENRYYRSLVPGSPDFHPLSPSVLHDAMVWLCQSSDSVLDFGCGSGGLSFYAAFLGVHKVIGIDLAFNAIQYANACAKHLPQCRFYHGSTRILQGFPDAHFDGIILSNILDNLRLEDTLVALKEAVRVLRPGGKAFIKLNSLLTEQQILDWNIQVIGEDLLDDGLLLLNKQDDFWLSLFDQYFTDIRQLDVFFEEYDQHNRLFLCVKK